MISFAVRVGLGNSTKICLMVLICGKVGNFARSWLWVGESEQEGKIGMMVIWF